jgi:hypothetical protein
MNYFSLEPECPGGLGPDSVVDRSVHPPIVSKLDYEFDTWPESDLIEAFPCFCISTKLIAVLQGLTGFSIEPMTVSKSETFEELHPDLDPPEFHWLKVHGVVGRDDFGLSEGHLLVVSQRALDAIKSGSLSHADIKHYQRLH